MIAQVSVFHGTHGAQTPLALSRKWTRRSSGGKSGPNKRLVLVAAERIGRVRLAHAANNEEATLKGFSDGQVAAQAQATTDGLASYMSGAWASGPMW